MARMAHFAVPAMSCGIMGPAIGCDPAARSRAMREDAPQKDPPAQIRLLRTKLFVPQPLPDLLARAQSQ